jgi:hypothetical protein
MFIEEALPMAEELELQGPAGPAPAVPQSSRPALEAAEEEAEQGSMF